MIKNNKNLYQEKLSSNNEERQEIERLIDEGLKIQKQGSSLSSHRDGTNSNSHLNSNVDQKNSDFNPTGQ